MLETDLTDVGSEHSSLNLALLALSEIAQRKSNDGLSYKEEDVEKFGDAIRANNDDEQIEQIERLIRAGVSLDIIYEKFIPEVAELLGNQWKSNKVTFVEVSIGAQRLQRLSRIYEKQYLGPLYSFASGPDILLILPKGEIHTLGLITASGIFKKAGSNPSVAVGYSENELLELVKKNEFKLIGLSVANSGNLSEAIAIANLMFNNLDQCPPIIIGGQGISRSTNEEQLKVFALSTQDPSEALKLIKQT